MADLPSALTAGGLPTDIPVSGIKAIDVASVRFLPFTVRVRLVPMAPEIGMIDITSGGGKVTVKISAKGADGLARPEDVFTATLLWVLGASAAMDRVIDTELPSAAAMGEPFMVIPVLGWKLTDDAPSKLAPFMVTVRLSVPIIPLLGVIDLIVGPKAIPTGSPLTGPNVVEVDEGDFSTSTPTSGDMRGVKVVPGCVVKVNVLAADATLVVVPPPVVIVTTLGSVGALTAMATLTVASVPAELTDGGLPTTIPVFVIKSTDVAPVRFLPLMLKVNIVPTWAWIGIIDIISGGGGVTVKIFAPIEAGLANPPGVVTATVLATWGAVNAIETDTVSEVPSGDTDVPFMVIPVFGWKATCDVPPRSAPLMITSRLDDPMAPLFGLIEVMVGPKAIPTGAAWTGPKVLDDEGGGGASRLTPTIGDKIGSLATSLGGMGGVFRIMPT